MTFYAKKQSEVHVIVISNAAPTALIFLSMTLLANLSGCSRSHKEGLTNPSGMKNPSTITSPDMGELTPTFSLVNQDGHKALKNPTGMEEILTITSPGIGEMAPAFTLLNQDKQSVSLQNLRGSWVVLYFFPKSDAPDCACHATEFTALLTELRQMNAKILGVNQDTAENHRMLRKKYALELDLLSDPQCNTMRAYEVYVDSQFGHIIVPGIIRTIFLIDPNGRIQSYWPDIISMVCAERVKHRLKQLQRGGLDTY